MRVFKLALSFLTGATIAFAPVLATASSASAQSTGCPSTSALAVCLTNSNNGDSISVPPGTEVDVYLTASISTSTGQTWRWTVPASSNNAVLAFESGGTSSNGNAWADFVAKSGGTADITSEESCVAAPGHACPQVVLLWQTSVSVVPTPTA